MYIIDVKYIYKFKAPADDVGGEGDARHGGEEVVGERLKVPRRVLPPHLAQHPAAPALPAQLLLL